MSFHLLNPKTHNRIQTRTVDPETNEEIPRSELVRGFEFEKGRYVIVTRKELEGIQIESTHTIDLQRFVDRASIRPEFWNSPYYVAPDGKLADEPFQVIREAMARKGMAGIGRVVLSSREHPVLVEPKDKGMLMVTLRPANEVRDSDRYFDDIRDAKLDKQMIELAEKIIEQKVGVFDPRELTGDRYQEALRALVAAKVKGEKLVLPHTAELGKVVNLMDALRRSVRGETAQDERTAPQKRAASKRRQSAEDEHAYAGRKPARKRRSG